MSQWMGNSTKTQYKSVKDRDIELDDDLEQISLDDEETTNVAPQKASSDDSK